MKMKQNTHMISGLFVFVLLGMFALAAMVIVLLGAQAYKASADRAFENNADRIAASYLRSKLRAADDQELLMQEDLDGADCLRITDSREGTVTMLYVYDGTLYEWYTLEDLAAAFDYEGLAQEQDTSAGPWVPGESICQLDEMAISAEDGLVTIRLRENDQWTTLQYAIRSAIK